MKRLTPTLLVLLTTTLLSLHAPNVGAQPTISAPAVGADIQQGPLGLFGFQITPEVWAACAPWFIGDQYLGNDQWMASFGGILNGQNGTGGSVMASVIYNNPELIGLYNTISASIGMGQTWNFGGNVNMNMSGEAGLITEYAWLGFGDPPAGGFEGNPDMPNNDSPYFMFGGGSELDIVCQGGELTIAFNGSILTSDPMSGTYNNFELESIASFQFDNGLGVNACAGFSQWLQNPNSLPCGAYYFAETSANYDFGHSKDGGHRNSIEAGVKTGMPGTKYTADIGLQPFIQLSHKLW